MSVVPSVKLSNSVEIPQLGFGVFQMTPEEAERSVVDALQVGYRSIDTAASYRNEEAVGRGIKRSGVPREDIFITTKLWVPDVNYEGASEAFQRSQDNLGLDYIDLYLIHQPYNDVFGAWRAMEELLEAGKVKAIGVANFASAKLVDFVLNVKTKPMVNQIETHPFNQQVEAHKIMEEYGIIHEGWSPFAEGRQGLFTNGVLAKIAESHGKGVGQVVLRWNMQRGIVAIPKSVHKERIEENIDIFDFELSKDDMERIAALDEHKGLFVSHDDPEFVKYLYNRDTSN
jgi:diketogulonate reductase-like aldo/keto reductase